MTPASTGIKLDPKMKASESLPLSVAALLLALLCGLALTGCASHGYRSPYQPERKHARYAVPTFSAIAGTSYPYRGAFGGMTVNGINMLNPLQR